MSDLTNEILIEIRDEIRATRTDLSARIDRTNERLERSNERLDRGVQEQIRQATAIVELEAGQREVRAGLRDMQRDMNEGLAGVTREIRSLNSRIDNVLTGSVGSTVKEHESRIRRVEEHLGLTGPSK